MLKVWYRHKPISPADFMSIGYYLIIPDFLPDFFSNFVQTFT